MLRSEFELWLDHHMATYPSLKTWLAGNTGTAARWARALEDVSLTEAKLATDAMMSGDLEKPRGWSDHPPVIRKWARQRETVLKRAKSMTFIDGNLVYDCPLCSDTGLVSILHPKMTRDIHEGKRTRERPGDRLRCAVACSCGAGDLYMRQPDMQRYVDSQMVPVDGPKGYDPVSELFDRVELHDFGRSN